MDNMKQLVQQLKQLDAALQKIAVVQQWQRGLVRILLNGRQDVLGLRVDHQFFYRANGDQLAAALKEVFNQALKLSKERARQETIEITGYDLSAWGEFF